MCAAAQDDRQFVSIIGFECRGMDVVNWHPEVQVHQLYSLLYSQYTSFMAVAFDAQVCH